MKIGKFKVKRNSAILGGIFVLAVLGAAYFGGYLGAVSYGGTTLSLDDVLTKWSDSRFSHAYLITYAADGKGETASGTMLEKGDALPNQRQVTKDVEFKITRLKENCVYGFQKTTGEVLKYAFVNVTSFSQYWLASQREEHSKDWCDALGGIRLQYGATGDYVCYNWKDLAPVGEFVHTTTNWEMDFTVQIGSESETKTLSSGAAGANVNFGDLAYVHVPGALTTGLYCPESGNSRVIFYQNAWKVVDANKLDAALNYQRGNEFGSCLQAALSSTSTANFESAATSCGITANLKEQFALSGTNSFSTSIKLLNSTNDQGYYEYDLGADKTIIPVAQVYVNAEKMSGPLTINIPINAPDLSNCMGGTAETGDTLIAKANLGSVNNAGGNFIVGLSGCGTSMYGQQSKTYVLREGETKEISLTLNNANILQETCKIVATSASDASKRDECSIIVNWIAPKVGTETSGTGGIGEGTGGTQLSPWLILLVLLGLAAGGYYIYTTQGKDKRR